MLSNLFRFACNDLTIHVKLDDMIHILCPNILLQNYLPSQSEADRPIYENAYFLDQDKQAYDSCNATGIFLYNICRSQH